MIIHCPSCGYSRKPTDTAPSSQCPDCGIIFEKMLSRRPIQKAVTKPATEAERAEAPPQSEAKVGQETDLSKTTNCPACGGLVAYGAKSCPHCGKSNPAPKPPTKVTRKHVLIAALLLFVYLVYGVNNPPKPLSGDEIAQLCADEAGIPRNVPGHAITPVEFKTMIACTERYVGRR